MGGGVGRWPIGGATREQCGSKKRCTVPLLGSLKNLTTGRRARGDWGRRGEVAHGGRARGEMRGGPRKLHWFPDSLHRTTGLIGGPWRAGKGGR